MTVIYSDFGDVDTSVLKNIWGDLDAKIIRLKGAPITKDYDVNKTVDKAIAAEEDTLIVVGHGSDRGCWSPSGEYTISPFNLDLVKAKKFIGIWCHASDFARRYHAKGFFSGMFISNASEAIYTLPYSKNQVYSNKQITESEIKFCNILNDFLKKDTPLKDWKYIIEGYTDNTFEVEKYNYSHVEYFG